MKNIKKYLIIFTTLIFFTVQSQNKKAMDSIKTSEIKPLNIQPSATSSEKDFDF